MGRPTKAELEAKEAELKALEEALKIKEAELKAKLNTGKIEEKKEKVSLKQKAKSGSEQKEKRNVVKIPKDLEIKTMQITDGTFVWVDKVTNEYHETTGYGDEDWYTFAEIQRMSRSGRKNFEFFLITIIGVEDNEEDVTVDDVLKKLKLEKLYADFDHETLDWLLLTAGIEDFENFCENNSKKTLRILYDRAHALFVEKRFSDKNKMNIIERCADQEDWLFEN